MALTHENGRERTLRPYMATAIPNQASNGVATPSAASTAHCSSGSPTAFATILDALVRDRGLSNAQLGTAIAVDQSYIHRLRSGTRNPSRAVVTAICDALGLFGAPRDRLLISAGFFPWGVPDDTTLWLLRQTMEVSE